MPPTLSNPSPAPVREEAPGAPPAPRHPLSLPHFRNLWLGSTLSMVGDQFYLVAVPWLVLQLTGSSLALGAMMMTRAIPRTALMLVGGAMTDRLSPRRVLILAAVARTVLVCTLVALLWLDVIELWQLFTLSLLFGIVDAFSFPAGPALIPALVPPQQLQPANAMLRTSMVLAQMVGPAPAGLVVMRWGIAPALVFDALSFLAVIAALFRIPKPPAAPAPGTGAAARPRMLDSISEGLRTVRSDPALRSLMVVVATLNLCMAGPIGVGISTTAKFHFGSAAAFGILLTCFGGGTLAGVLLGGRVKRPRRRGLQLLLVGMLTGLELVAIGLVPRLGVLGALMALMGFGVGFVNVQFSAWIQLRVDRALLGRVLSVLMTFSVGLAPVSYVVSGTLASWSLVGLFVTTGAILTITSCAMALTAAREID